MISPKNVTITKKVKCVHGLILLSYKNIFCFHKTKFQNEKTKS